MLDKLTRGIVILSLIAFPQSYTAPSFAIETEKKEYELNIITQKKGYENIQDDFQKKKEIKAEQERLQKIKEEEERIKKEKIEQIKKEQESYNIEFELTFYSRHPSENGGYNKTASGIPLQEGIVANNNYPLGTKIKLEDGRVFIVADRGSQKHFNNNYRLDVFVDTYDQQYVSNLGRKKIKGKIIK